MRLNQDLQTLPTSAHILSSIKEIKHSKTILAKTTRMVQFIIQVILARRHLGAHFVPQQLSGQYTLSYRSIKNKQKTC